MSLTAADIFRDAACGRVVAMLASKDDAPEQVVRRLATALEEPTVIPKPVMRLDTCIVMLFLGVLLGLVCRRTWSEDCLPFISNKSEDSDDATEDAMADDNGDSEQTKE